MTKWIENVEGVSNFRDLSTGSFPENLVYRSADLSHLTETGIQVLSGYVETIIDVRSMPEIKRNGTVGPSDKACTEKSLSNLAIKRLHCPIFLEKDYSPAEISARHNLYKSGHDGFVEAYRGILAHMGPALQTIFSELRRLLSTDATHTRRGILIHCSAGKDRTGVLCACLLLVAGLTPAEVAQEYALTTQGLAAQHDRIIASLGPGASTQDKKLTALMISSDAIVMERTIEIINKEFSGIERLCLKYVNEDDYRFVQAKIASTSKPTL